MNLSLNNLQKLICHKPKPTNHQILTACIEKTQNSVRYLSAFSFSVTEISIPKKKKTLNLEF